MRKSVSKIREYIPLFSLIVYALTLVSLILFIIVVNSVAFADFFNYYLTAPTRAIMAWMLVLFPFSVAEVVVLASPILLILLVFMAVKFAKKGKRASIKFLSVIVAVLCLVFITFVWTYSSGYHNSKIDDKMGLDTDSITKDELYSAYTHIVSELNYLADYIKYDETGASVMPYSYSEMSAKICEAYEKFTSEYDVLHTFPSRIKPLIISEPMTYTHLSGIYSFMSGECNVNVNYPDYVIASTSAHEMAHQRGVAREEECNFIAFAVLTYSDDPFLRYCAYLDVYSNIAVAVIGESTDLYLSVSLDSRVRQDRKSYSEFFKKYEDSKASEVAGSINNSYLQANGQENGTKSYDMITELVCAFLLNKTK